MSFYAAVSLLKRLHVVNRRFIESAYAAQLARGHSHWTCFTPKAQKNWQEYKADFGLVI